MARAHFLVNLESLDMSVCQLIFPAIFQLGYQHCLFLASVYCDVEPKRLALQAANSELAGAQEKLAQIQVSQISARLLTK